jgi:two-component system chemotaxis response regulator CheY
MMNAALVVDDSRAIRGILSKVLISNGFQVYQAGNGIEALKALQGESAGISLMCADYKMPEMNGIELITRMRTLPRFGLVPVIMIATETHMQSMQAAFAASANEYVIKPFTADMAKDKLRVLGIVKD